jgi:maltose alpha-D-glucosyltransferase/alpha-amylase
MDPVYGYQSINVEAQERSPFSLLNWMKRMIGLRKQFSVFGRGTIEFQSTHNRKVLAYVRRYEDDTILCVANLARSVQPVELDLSRFKGLIPVEMLGLTEFPRIGELPYFLTLPGYAFYWFRLQHTPTPLTARVAPDTGPDTPHAPPLFVGAAWDTLLDGNVRTLIEHDRLLPFLQRQRWFGGKARPARAARFADWGLLRRGPQPLFLTVVEVTFEDGTSDRYFLPLAICPYADARPLEERTPHAALAAVTGARRGLLVDASHDDRFARTILDALEREEHVTLKRGTIRTLRGSRFATARGPDGGDLRVWRLSGEQSNTSIVYGTRLIAKLFRRLEEGINPDYEVGRHLTEVVGFDRVPAIAGAFEYTGANLIPTTVAMVQELVESQADGWSHATDDVARFYDQVETRTPLAADRIASYSELIDREVPNLIQDAMGGYLETAGVLGRRSAEMHLALASDARDPAFAPEPLTPMDLDRVAVDISGQARAALDTLGALDLGRGSSKLPADVAERARRLLVMRDQLLDGSRTAVPMEFTASKIRIHGDYHLGQVLWAEGDYYILDFEGEPARPLAERRDKQSPLKDVAGMVRSYGYAAYAALFAHAATRPGDFQRLEPWARTWQTWATAAFLRAYFATADKALFVPAAPSQRDALLGLFVLGKALYELNYELNNRPDWVRIPLWGILELLNAD